MADEIFRLDIDIQAMLKKQQELKKETDDLKQSIKELDTTTEEGRKKFVAQEATLKKLQSEYSANRTALSKLSDETGKFGKATDLANKALDRQIDSIEDARESNKELLNIRNKVNVNTEAGRKAIERINQKLNENNAFIKENVSNYEQQKIGIGDYEGAIKRALPGLSGLIDSTKGLVSSLIAKKAAIESTISGTSGATKAWKLLDLAFKASVIGAIVGILASLVAYFTKTQQGMEKVERVTAKLNAAWEVLVDRGAKIGSILGSLFSGQKSLSEAWNEGKEALSGINEELSREIKLAGELKSIQQDLLKDEQLLNFQRSAANTRIKELNKLVEDTTANLEDRLSAAREIEKIETELAQKERENADQALAIALGKKELDEEAIELLNQLKNGTADYQEVLDNLGLSNSTKDDVDDLLDKFEKAEAAQQRSLEVRTTNQNKLNTIIQQGNAQEEAQLKQREESLKKQLDSSIEQMQRNLEEYRILNQSKLDSEQELSEKLIAEEEQRMTEILNMQYDILQKQVEAEKMTQEQANLEKLKLETEYQKELSAIKDEYLDQEAEKLFEALEKEKEDNELRKEREAEEYETYLALQEERGANEFQLQQERLEREKQQAIEAAKAKGIATTNIEQTYALKKEKIDRERELAQVQSVQNTIAGIGSTYESYFGSSKELNIALASADALIGAQKAYISQLIPGDPTSVPRAVAASLQAALFGAKNVSKIQAVQFEDGGLLQGPLHRDGGIPLTIAGRGGYEAEGGEYIVNRKATAAFLPLLESINRQYKVSGSSGVGLFQNGGIITSQLPSINGQGNASFDYRKFAQAVAEGVSQMPPGVILVEDINRGQQRVAEVVEGATI